MEALNDDLSPLSQKAIKLFSYLRELVQLRSKIITDLSSYERTLWIKDIPSEPECHCILWGIDKEDTDTWIEIKKPREPKCPEPPKSCEAWHDKATLRNTEQSPQLKDQILAPDPENPEEPGKRVLLSDSPNVSRAWIRYLNEKWLPWTDDHKRWRKVQTVYEQLFHIHQQQKNFGETYEVLIGLGLLQWITPSKSRINRHVLTIRGSVEFDTNTGTLTVQEPSEGGDIHFEDDMLDPTERLSPDQQSTLEKLLVPLKEDPWDKSTLFTCITAWSHALRSNSEFVDSNIPAAESSEKPVVTYAPALILRKRNDRGLLSAYSKIIDQLNDGGPVPETVQMMCEVVETSSGKNGQTGSEPTNEAPDLIETFLPLSVNEEQRKIISRLGKRRGVLVQGPPGTGKTHTIANLICHLLASGKKVLVTSQTARALKVLKNKLPKQVASLCVSILGNDIHSLKELEDSVLNITGRFNDWDQRDDGIAIDKTRQRLNDLKKEAADLQARARESREKDTTTYSIRESAYKGTAQQIAQKVAKEANDFAWFNDVIAEDLEPQFSSDEALERLKLVNEVPEARTSEIMKGAVALKEVPSTDKFHELVLEWKSAEHKHKDLMSYSETKYAKALKGSSRESRLAIKDAISHLQAEIENLRHYPFAWVEKGVSDILLNQDRPWLELKDAASKHLIGLKQEIERHADASVSVPEGLSLAQLKANLEDRLKHYRAGGGNGFWVFKASVLRETAYFETRVTVNGRPCRTAELSETLLQWVETKLRLERLWELWSPFSERPSGPWIHQFGKLTEYGEVLEAYLSLHQRLSTAKTAIAAVTGLQQPSWMKKDELAQLLNTIEYVESDTVLNTLNGRLNEIARLLRNQTSERDSHPVNKELLAALEAKSYEQWAGSLQALTSLYENREKLGRMKLLSSKVEQHTPHLYSAIISSAANEDWKSRLLRIPAAWNLGAARSWLERYEREHDGESIRTRLGQVEKSTQLTTEELSSLLAWNHCFNRMSEPQRISLMAWAKAISRIGKGTGKRAEKHRRDAQGHMQTCKEFIPAWIMPLFRAADTIDPKPGLFDVVIVDEASQCGPDALLLLYLAQQCIIVGDDQQISPEHVGVERDEVDVLARRYLKDLVAPDAFGLESSLFTQGEIRFGNRIVLKEHFRCMPEIINFSNDLCYANTPLIPLRQYPPKRLEPIHVKYIRAGYCEGQDHQVQNPPEAEAIVEDILQCISKPEYQGKTFGVISLQGTSQAKAIEALLLKRVDLEEMKNRQLVCGDSYAFQGDERDVMFLSLVTAPNRRSHALTRETDKRRFNVAASRAKDQVRLYHSTPLEELSTQCLRYRLLNYYMNYKTPIESGQFDFDKCESEFERDVARVLLARKYRVIPQYPISGKRIDLVVEGHASRIAIECDGDQWHGLDQYEADMARERMLSRCGMTFWRIRGTSFYRNPEKAMIPLWDILNKMKIFPLDAPNGLEAVSPNTTPPSTAFDLSIKAAPTLPLEDDSNDGDLDFEEADDHPKIDDVPQEALRRALFQKLPDAGPIDREELKRAISQSLGFNRLGRRISKRINRLIGAEIRAGRVATDEAWINVWRVSEKS